MNIDTWPGPNRKKWLGLRDEIYESPGGGFAAVVYSCGEVGICKEVGRFALLAGPPEKPRLQVRPRGLTCLVRFQGTTVQWIGDRYCVIQTYCIKPTLSGCTQSVSGAMYFDVSERRVAYVAGASPPDGITSVPDGLQWHGWWRPSLWPRLWHTT